MSDSFGDTMPMASADLDSVEAREAVNGDLAEALAGPLLGPESAWAKVQSVLRENGYHLPYALMDIHDADGEDVYGLTETTFLYFAFFQEETGWYDCYAEVLTEEELHVLMADANEGDESDENF